jgi:hypothetical protein
VLPSPLTFRRQVADQLLQNENAIKKQMTPGQKADEVLQNLRKTMKRL